MVATQRLSVVATKRELNRHGPQEGVTLRYIFFIIKKLVFFYLHRNNVIYYWKIPGFGSSCYSAGCCRGNFDVYWSMIESYRDFRSPENVAMDFSAIQTKILKFQVYNWAMKWSLMIVILKLSLFELLKQTDFRRFLLLETPMHRICVLTSSAQFSPWAMVLLTLSLTVKSWLCHYWWFGYTPPDGAW